MKQRKNGHRSIVSAASLLSLTALAVATSVVSCAEEDLVNSIPMSNVLTFQVKVNDAVETKTRSGIDNTLDGFFPTSSLELRSDDNTIFYANCEERNGIHMHYDTSNTKTRGTVRNNNNFYDSFLLYGYTYGSGEEFTSSTSVNSSINGVSVSKGSGTTWQPTGVTWPGADKKATFYAIAPADAVTPSADAGGPRFTYTVPQSAFDQKDLLVSKCENVSCDGKSAPTLTFNHALAAIKFAQGTITPYTSITKVEITGVYSNGTYNMNNDSWSGQSSTDNYSISSTDDVLFLMPQTLPSGAQLKVTLSNGSTTKVLTSDLSNKEWKKGNQYTYSISVDQITGTFKIEVTQTVSAPKAGGDATISVKSYFEYGDRSTKISVPWTATYSNDSGTQTINGDGNYADGETKDVSIGENPSITIEHANTLKNNRVGTVDAPYDLSMFNGVQSTANCYVVQGCGWYKLPLVYGNGITKGVVANGSNGFCFDSSTNYMNHAGTAINQLKNKPYIYGNDGYSLSSGEIVWESITGLIQSGSVQLCDDGKYLKFYVDPDKVQQGNAVIAVKTSDGTIAWSWHIWVTDAAWEATYTYGNYNFMCMPLGFVDGSTSPTSAAPRTVNLQFTQNISGGASKTVKISQEGDASISGTCTFYQWGRKDPFKAENQTTTADGQVAQSAAIQNPGQFIKYSGNWSTAEGYDYWCVGNTSTGTSSANPVKKSIYDPSPVGYCVPPSAAHAALSMGQSGLKYDNTNGFSNSANGDYWQLFGYIDMSSGSMDRAGNFGDFWSASPNISNKAYYLRCSYYDGGVVFPRNNYYRSTGYAVRPVSE